MGPWGHDPYLDHLVGDVNVGFAGAGAVDRLFGKMLDFYGAAIAERESGLPRVSVYVLGAQRWVGRDEWPPPGSTRTAAPLAPGEVAVEPGDPVPSLGGRALLVQVPGWGWGVRDQRPVAEREDVVVAARHSSTERRWLAGPAFAVLRTEARRGSTWAVTLCVEQPDGALHNLTEGVAIDDGTARPPFSSATCARPWSPASDRGARGG